ncbi:MAG: multiheme c-type cytochrome [Fimbriimonadaceae bacterium]
MMWVRARSYSGWCAALAVLGVWAGALTPRRAAPLNVLIGGDTQGYLSPCGCTSPMTGGIRRMASAIAMYRGAGGVFLENGGLVEENPPNGRVGRKQSVMKALALADALRAMGVDALNVGQEEIATGRGTLLSIEQLTNRAALSTSLAPAASNALPQWRRRGPFLIGGITPAATNLALVTGETAVPALTAAHRLVAEAAREHLTPVLMYRGGEGDAAGLARAEPALALIVYKSAGTAPEMPITVGQTLLVTPGDRTKNLVRLEFDGAAFSHYRLVTLTPTYGDDPTVSRYYRDYLTRVDRAHLIEQLPRTKTAAFAGSAACLSCHGAAYRTWHASAHAHALADLERQGHARDPDCLSCHVTGLASTVGFRTRALTPKFANVTCESCHGPALDHVRAPRTYRLPKLSEQSCLKCHTPDNSPNFAFQPFWRKVFHH